MVLAPSCLVDPLDFVCIGVHLGVFVAVGEGRSSTKVTAASIRGAHGRCPSSSGNLRPHWANTVTTAFESDGLKVGFIFKTPPCPLVNRFHASYWSLCR